MLVPSRKIKRGESEGGDKEGRQGIGEEKEEKKAVIKVFCIYHNGQLVWALKKGNSEVGWKQDRQRSNESEAQRKRRVYQKSE